MGAHLLCDPFVQLFLLALGAGLLLAFCSAGSGPRGQEAGSAAPARGEPPGQGPAASTRGAGNLDHYLREIEAACAAEYAARFGLALRRIRLP
jgi:hypothetical protein